MSHTPPLCQLLGVFSTRFSLFIQYVKIRKTYSRSDLYLLHTLRKAVTLWATAQQIFPSRRSGECEIHVMCLISLKNHHIALVANEYLQTVVQCFFVCVFFLKCGPL